MVKKTKLTWKDYLTEDALIIHDVDLPLSPDGLAEVLFNGDTHFGNPVYNQTKVPMKVVKSQIEFVQSKDYRRVFDMGDAMELISLRPKRHLAKGRVPLMKEEAELFLKVWNGALWQIEAKVQGNHEFRASLELDKLGLAGMGIPIVDRELLKANSRCVLAEEERGLLLRLKVGDIVYKGYIAHGTGSSGRPDFHLRKVLQNVCADLDFVALAHIHQFFHDDFTILSIPNKGRYPIRMSRIGIRTGTTVPYLAYAEKNTRTVSQLGNTFVTFRSDRKQIIVDNLIKRILL